MKYAGAEEKIALARAEKAVKLSEGGGSACWDPTDTEAETALPHGPKLASEFASI